MNNLDQTMILRGWAYRVPVLNPAVMVLVSPSEQLSLGHTLRYDLPAGNEEVVPFEDRRKHERRTI